MSSWGSTSVSASDVSGISTRRRLSEEGMSKEGLEFRNMDSQKDGQFSDEDDNSISEGDGENWDSDNATADENSEMFGDGSAMPDWSSDEDGEATNLDTCGSSRSSSVVNCLSPSVGVVSPFSPIMPGNHPTKGNISLSRVRRRQKRMLNEMVDDLGKKVRKMNHNEYADGMEFLNRTPFRGGTTPTATEQIMSGSGYISEASSSSRASSRVGFELSVAGQQPSQFHCTQAPVAFPPPDSDMMNIGGGVEVVDDQGVGQRASVRPRFAHDYSHSECIIRDDLA